MILSNSTLSHLPFIGFSNAINLSKYCHKDPSIFKVKRLDFHNFIDLEKAKSSINCKTLAAQQKCQIISDQDISDPRFKQTSRVRKSLQRIDQAASFLRAARISEQRIEEMQGRSFVLEAYHTTHIEGSDLSLYQSKRLLRGKKVQNASADDVQELLNYKKAHQQMTRSIDDSYPLSEIFIRQIHQLLLANVRGNSATPGEYRKVQNCVTNSQTGELIYTPPASYEVPPLMVKLVRWINDEKDLHPVLVAAIAQFQLVHIHPFLDGNGRVARLLSAFCLYRSGYDFKQLFTISKYCDRNRVAYYKAIQDVRDNEMDLTNWLEYFTQGLSTQMSNLERKCEEIVHFEVVQSLEKISGDQKKTLELLRFRIDETIKKYISLRPFVDCEKLKNEIFSIVESDL